ncbi:MAG: glutamate--tRNA ligase [Syntrophorhabdaceae bacterium]|nr:glutamate--tRNA ligase [Syntrophorhabdaceae bacterium]
MSDIVTRFAPSPTGYLHIGGARTALFNWLFARRSGGKFILRIEDTDQERSTPEAVQAILDGMSWLGILWDEGPYFQMERMDLYRKEADRLLSEGKAYRCICSKDDLDARREAMKARGEKPRYDRQCADLPPEATEGKPHVVRIRTPLSGKTVVSDLFRGEVAFDNTELDDLILLRTDGSPTYNYVVVVDDASMGITHVLRGDDHLNNTPKQIILYQALGYPLPRFGHFPLIHGMEGGKLSKRQDDVSVIAYKDKGFLPEAMVNYLVRLGWGHGDQEIFSIAEMTEFFSLEHVGKSPSKFNMDKLLHLNAHYIKTSDPALIAELILPFLEKRGIHEKPTPWMARAVKTLQERSHTLEDMAEAMEFYFREKPADPKAAAKFLTAGIAPVLSEIADEFAGLSDFDAQAENAVKTVLDRRGGNLKIHQPIRVAITGSSASPDLFDVIRLLGKDEVVRRLRNAVGRIETVA